MDTSIAFKLIRFNPRRYSRGADAAEVQWTDEDGSELLWMSRKDVENSIRDFGPHPELQKALEHYRTVKEFPV